jgi:hypothetical protein
LGGLFETAHVCKGHSCGTQRDRLAILTST